MARVRYQRIDIAGRQLQTAINMFLSGKDRFSVITLAGAASGQLTHLVLRVGKEPFVDYGREVVKEQTGKMLKRDAYKRHVNLWLGVDHLKHHAPHDPLEIKLDVERAAEAAITRALADYIQVRGQDDPFIRDFLNWAWITRDGPALMEAYKERAKFIQRPIVKLATYSKLEIASHQLRSAVMLFCSACDRFSAISLAAAADAIVSQLLLIEGKENLSDDLMRADFERTGVMPNRAEHGRAVNDLLHVNALKHTNPKDDEFIEMDVRVDALASVAKGIANYASLVGDNPDFVGAFRLWAKLFVPRGVDEEGNPRP